MSNEAKHTPGPWRIDEDSDDFPVVVGPRKGARRFGVEGEWDICLMDKDEDPSRRGVIMANARLIAAAPDMLAALKAQEAADDAGEKRSGLRQWQALEDKAVALRFAAVSKAEGRS